METTTLESGEIFRVGDVWETVGHNWAWGVPTGTLFRVKSVDHNVVFEVDEYPDELGPFEGKKPNRTTIDKHALKQAVADETLVPADGWSSVHE